MTLRCTQNGNGIIDAVAVLLTITLLAILATPSFMTLRETQKTIALINEVTTHLAITRSAAVTHGTDAIMCPRGEGQLCADTHDWSRGWLIYLDPDGNRSPDRDSDIIFSHAAQATERSRLLTSQGRKQIRYIFNGRTGTSNATFYVCNGKSQKGRITINVGGRARSSRTTSPVPCPS